MGKVYLIGAGCGNYDLMTVKGMAILKQADCVLYDRLIDPQLLLMLKENCEKIDVGKENHHHTMPQQTIEEVLIEKARQYPCVVRLKGGDPYVFGRGGEEAIALSSAGIAFEVVPGISSCIAALTYAGFPITHRGINRGFRVYSAHTSKDTLSDLDYASMAESKDTLVFLMGRKHKQELLTQLLLHGKDRSTPVAFISNGARYDQRVVMTSIEEALHCEIEMESPCTIVVGDVISLTSKTNFLDQLPLLGKRILIPILQKEVQGDFLRALGAMVEEVQVGYIKERSHMLDDLDLNMVNCLVFTSVHGVESFFHQLLESGKDARSLVGIKIASIGKKTSAALHRCGIQADIETKKSDSKHLAEVLNRHIDPMDHVVIAKASNDNHTLEESLSCDHITTIPLYASVAIPFETVYEHYDAMVFTSAFHVRACKEILHQATRCFSIGPHTSKALQDEGVTSIIESKQADKAVLLDIVREELSHV